MISKPQETEDYFHQYWFPNASSHELEELWKAYPSDPAKGSPFDTGLNNTRLSPQFKRISAIIGDTVMEAPRRKFLNDINAKQDTWGFCKLYSMTHTGFR